MEQLKKITVHFCDGRKFEITDPEILEVFNEEAFEALHNGKIFYVEYDHGN